MQMTKSIEEEIKLGIFSKCETATVFYDKIVVSGLMNNKKRRHCQPPPKIVSKFCKLRVTEAFMS